MSIFLAIVQIISSVAIIVLVLMQKAKTDGMAGAVTGATAESFYGKEKGKGKQSVLNKLTIVFSILMLIATVAITAISLK